MPRPSIIHRFRLFGITALLFMFFSSEGLTDTVSEYDLKAAYLLNFANYVEWPGQAEPITICIYGESPFKTTTIASLLEAKAGQINASFKYPHHLEQLADCKIIFLAPSEHENHAKAIARLHDAPILIVTDIQEGLPPGAMINLITESNHLTFEVSMNAISSTQLKISSKLLKLAKIVP